MLHARAHREDAHAETTPRVIKRRETRSYHNHNFVLMLFDWCSCFDNCVHRVIEVSWTAATTQRHARPQLCIGPSSKIPFRSGCQGRLVAQARGCKEINQSWLLSSYPLKAQHLTRIMAMGVGTPPSGPFWHTFGQAWWAAVAKAKPCSVCSPCPTIPSHVFERRLGDSAFVVEMWEAIALHVGATWCDTT